jgi:hypothetical protein
MLRYIVLVICSLFFTVVKAQHFSYVYIQGDKETPFYVKYEDEMLPRFGKNYYIISELAPGPLNLQILFQQNAYPAQKFTVNVPENGFRGFLLTNKKGYFSLYDIHRQFYIPAGNKAVDDNYMTYTAGTPTVPVDDITPALKETEKWVIDKPATPVKAPKPTVAKEPKSISVKSPKTVLKKPATKLPKTVGTPGEPVFIDNVELKSERSGNTVPAGGVVKNKLAIVNSDCPTAISNDSFDEIYKKAVTRSSTGKLKFLLEKIENNCYTSNQVRQLAQVLSGDSERLTYLKRAYPRVTDQSAFQRLENLLTTEEWKGYFRSMLQPQ